MFFNLCVFVTGIIQILGRSTVNGNPIKEKEVFMLPAEFHSNDVINITINTTENPPNMISIGFMGPDDKNTTHIPYFSIIADMNSKMFTILNKRGEPEIKQELFHFLLDDGDKKIFNLWLQRRENKDDGDFNVMQVNTNSYTEAFTVYNIENLRYLEFNGGNAKMMNLDFAFA